ncbi:MAG: sigma-70 family RNA polymerase sigma factor [Acidimicrobiales bacterium]|jgi:RNA polymerase primary sigma factor|nr:sigma-70 family RNA polymerase sigma factor [Acidimicrobiales bacterium]MDP6241512.1 sigma-70 family RNA polymerase sigma factor [Acidimicrobiales bacterium]MDP7124752.1 sigma-70 family RNA polymerase sigma factor [Acidimicrobiales bacterium]MDP7353355.1 sigma-70 family RNA polymerase sigma factor [Acidimicrobiales bacterium]MDP7507163.1 sigma-70 family RNA polymerase sigma factor [Acidimicrobiales bacterium]|tara:strand:+ start:3011 stop:4282 length:1272 start_codon:yes stop_codon:yes gene_type:complete
MGDAAPNAHWARVSEFEFVRLLRRGRARGRLTLDEVIDVLQDAELTPELIGEMRAALDAEGIELDETVVDATVDVDVDADIDDEREVLRLIRPRQRSARRRDPAKHPSERGDSGDSTRMYLREIGEVALLSAVEEVELATAIGDGNVAEAELADLAVAGKLEHVERVVLVRLRRRQRAGEMARDRLTRANLRLVVSIAKRHVGRGLPLLDLVQEGNLGLMRAVEKFDHSKGFKFSTYATWWIRQAVTRAVADQARTIRIPVHMVDAMNRCVRIERELQQELERKPSVEEIADRALLDLDKVEDLLELARNQIPLSLDSTYGDEQDVSLADLVADLDAEDAVLAATRRLLKEDILEVLDQLDGRERDVVRMRFGLDDAKPATLEEVGRRFGVTRERVRQIESRTMAKLRHPLRSEKLRDYLDES